MSDLMGTAPTAVEIDALRAEIERLRSAILAERSKAVEAMDTLSTRLAKKANEHDLCEAYDEVIEEVNAALPADFPRLSPRTRTWKVSATFTVTIEREIDATRRDDAVEEFRTEVEGELDTLETNGEIDGYSLDEYEVEVES